MYIVVWQKRGEMCDRVGISQKGVRRSSLMAEAVSSYWQYYLGGFLLGSARGAFADSRALSGLGE